MKNYKHNNMYINADRYGRIIISGKPLDNMPSLEWENINTDVSVITDCNLRVKDGIADENVNRLNLHELSITESEITVTYKSVPEMIADNLSITENFFPYSGMNVVRQITTVKNNSSTPIRLAALSSAKVMGIGLYSEVWHKNPARWRVHYCRSAWQGEGQWRCETLEDLGMYPTNDHVWAKNTFSVSSQSSFSTAKYYPAMIIEDLLLGESYFFEIEGGVSWQIQGSAYGGSKSECFHVSLTAATETLGWSYKLMPGESYTTVPAVYGIVKGGFNEAVCEMLRYKRADSLCKRRFPVVFNDFMNCSWGMPNRENLIPLIDAAATAGCECFCIDAGWHKSLGDWAIDESKFGEGGLSGILDYIKSRNMLPGVWFEWESCSREFANSHSKWLLKRQGADVSVQRPLLDMRNSEVIAYLLDCVDRVYKMGVRYIKNDYNHDTGVGADNYGDSPAEGLRKNYDALIEFVDFLHKKYPDLYIENCASGGMRADNGTLKHFDVQSLSDQEDYTRLPSILVGCSAFIPPEKLGVWAYPFPMTYENIGKSIIPPETIESFRDGEQTVFNMVSGFMGALYLSGHIDNCDEKNMLLIRQAISEYKEWKSFIGSAYPQYLCPMRRMSDLSYNAYGLINVEHSKMLVALWNLNTEEFTLDLKRYNFSRLEKLYPEDYNGYNVNFENGILSVTAGGKNRARLIVLS